ncbi:hypothetical protein PIB30_007845, partial [Stylosanthes scabra]|nr:hypothetical protein [Stylosanthes scabra]
MSSIRVCEGLQSCLEPRVIEPRVLRLKLAPSAAASELESHQQEQQPEKKDWSFLEAVSQLPCNNKDEKVVYVHPTLKRSSSMLNPNSLEMCTESLGSETGSLFSISHNNHNHTNTTTTTTLIKHTRKPNKPRTFPPPLTSITHHGGALRVMPHRRHGRLVLEAVTSPPETATYFHAERSHGRLRLGLCLYHHETEQDNDDDDHDVEDDEEEGVVRQFGRAMSNGSRCMDGGGNNTHFFGADYSLFDLIRT